MIFTCDKTNVHVHEHHVQRMLSAKLKYPSKWTLQNNVFKRLIGFVNRINLIVIFPFSRLAEWKRSSSDKIMHQPFGIIVAFNLSEIHYSVKKKKQQVNTCAVFLWTGKSKT